MSEGIKVKWEMHSFTKFTGFIGDYVLHLRKGSWWIWSIEKDGKQVDSCFSYKPTNSELAAKVQAEKAAIQWYNKNKSSNK